MRFIIQAWDYSTGSGGGVALHRLAHNLGVLGHEAILTCRTTCPGGKGIPRTDLGLGWSGATSPLRSEILSDSVVVYPEVTLGNPFRAPRVVRWILNSAGIFGVGGDFGRDDLFMLWSRDYSVPPENASQIGGILQAFREYEHFHDQGHPRKGTCYAIRKGGKKSLTHHSPDDLCIDDYMSKGGDDYLIEMFNSHERFVCYDHATLLPTLSALCGCLAIVIPDGIRSVEEVEKSGGLLAGVAWGMDDLPRARGTLTSAREELGLVIQESLRQTERFTHLCAEKWPSLVATVGGVLK